MPDSSVQSITTRMAFDPKVIVGHRRLAGDLPSQRETRMRSLRPPGCDTVP
jgi:hypothetical protein